MAMKKKNLPELVPQVFEHEQFGKVRVVKIDGKPWFVAVDVCRALDYKNSRKALADHVDAEDRKAITRKQWEKMASNQDSNETLLSFSYAISWFSPENMGGTQRLTLVNESGMYALIFGSQLPAAKKFKRWVTSEVLPSIRETGSYTTPQYDFFHPSPEELERRSKITTTAGIIEDLEAHGIDWDWEVTPRIEIDENGVKHLVYGCKLVIKHPEYEKLQKELAAKKSAGFLSD